MPRKPELTCAKCGGKMSLGGASRSSLKAYGSGRAIVASVARGFGWTEGPDGWDCGKHA